MEDPIKVPKSARKVAFCEHYAVLRNGTKAAKAAGYAEKNAGKYAFALLQDPEVQAYIRYLENERLSEARIDSVDVLLELKKVAFANIGNYIAFDGSSLQMKDSAELSEDQLAAISEVTLKPSKYGNSLGFKLHSKLDALSQIRAMQGLDEPKKSEKKLEVNIPNNVENKTFSLKTRSKKQDEEK